jgi:hypothetical protein
MGIKGNKTAAYSAPGMPHASSSDIRELSPMAEYQFL